MEAPPWKGFLDDVKPKKLDKRGWRFRHSIWSGCGFRKHGGCFALAPMESCPLTGMWSERDSLPFRYSKLEAVDVEVNDVGDRFHS